MKELLKKIALIVLSVVLVSALMLACKPPEPIDNEDNGGTLAAGTATVQVTGSYTSPIQMSYSNMRPTYSFYQTTVSYQVLSTYEDGTYCLADVAITASACDIVWSADDAGAKCNPRSTRIKMFYGQFTKKTVDGNSDALDLELSKPFRIIDGNVDSSGNILYAVDTANWEGVKPLNLAATATAPAIPNYNLNTADAYRLANAWNAMTVRITVSKNSFTKATLTVAAAAQRTLQDIPAAPSGVTAGPAFAKTVSAYMSPTDKNLGFEKLSDDSYRIAIQFQMIILYEDSYCFLQSSAVANNLWLAAQGSNFNTDGKNTGVEFVQYFGNYTVADNEYDDSLKDVTLRKALRIVGTFNTAGPVANGAATAVPASGYLVDSSNWTSQMGTATGKTSETFLSEKGFKTSTVYVVKENFTLTPVLNETTGESEITNASVKGGTPSSAMSFLRKDNKTATLEAVR